MKKLLLLPLMLLSPLSALPLGNPIDPRLYTNGIFWGDCFQNSCNPCSNWSFRTGFYGDYVFNRHMALNANNDASIDNFRLNTNAGYLDLNICNRIDIFGTLGLTDINLRANPTNFGLIADSRLFLESETAFSWSVGGRVTIWEWRCFYFGIEGQYLYTIPDVDIVAIDGLALVYPDSAVEVKYAEWQVGVGASYLYRVGCSGISVIPYSGFKWAGSKATFRNAIPTVGITLFDLENDKRWGWALGTTLLFCDALTLSVEGRWGDERALFVNGQFCF